MARLYKMMVLRTIVVLLVILGTLGLVAVRPAAAQMPVPLFGQRWDPWQWDRLGSSNLLIRDYGCAMTCAAMVLNYYGGNTNPGDLNNWLKANGGYANGNLIIWAVAARRAPNLTYYGGYNWTTVPADLTVINWWLDRGCPLIAETRIGASRSQQHFVVLTGRSGANYFMNDPWYGDRTTFQTRYGDARRWIYGLRIYRRP